MIKTPFTYLAIFALGAAAGSLATIKWSKQKYATIAEAEISSVKETYEKMRRKDEARIESLNATKLGEQVKEAIKSGITDSKHNSTGLTRGQLSNAYEQAKKNYNLISSSAKMNEEVEPSEPPDDDDEEDCKEEEDDEEVRDAAGLTESEHKQMAKVNNPEPYGIDDETFTNTNPHYDKVSLYYYKKDNVLCEESEEIITDVARTVGLGAIEALQKQMTLWVRNERLGIDYEIIGVNSSYKETVAGFREDAILTPRERYEKKRRTKKDVGE